MNLAKLRASASKNKIALGALGVLAVAAMAWRARTAGDTTTSSSTATQPAGTSTTPSYYTSGAAGTYDTTTTDLYDAIQPQLENLQQLYDKFSTIPVAGTPTTPTPAPTPSVQGVYARSGTQALYAALSDGTRKYLDSADWDAMGQATPTYLAADNPFFSRTLVNTDAPAAHRTPA